MRSSSPTPTPTTTSASSACSPSATPSSTPRPRDRRVLLIAPRALRNFLSDYQAVDPNVRHGYLPLTARRFSTGTSTGRASSRPARDGASPPCSGYHTSPRWPWRTAPGCTGWCWTARGSGGWCSWGTVGRAGRWWRQRGRCVWVVVERVCVGLLVHDATFEDGMEAEALVERHSTVGEVLGVGRGMGRRQWC